MSDEVLERVSKALNDLRSVIEHQQEMTRQHVSGIYGSTAHEIEMIKISLRDLVRTLDSLIKDIK